MIFVTGLTDYKISFSGIFLQIFIKLPRNAGTEVFPL
jgi:hypothetical protein